MRTGEWVVAENWRLCSATLVCGVGGELEDENWRPGSTTLVRRVAGDWEDEKHTHTQTHFHTDIDTRTETHTLPQLTRLHTFHCTLTG